MHNVPGGSRHICLLAYCQMYLHNVPVMTVDSSSDMNYKVKFMNEVGRHLALSNPESLCQSS